MNLSNYLSQSGLPDQTSLPKSKKPDLTTQLKSSSVLAAILVVATPANSIAQDSQDLPEYEQEDFSRHDFQFGFQVYSNPVCLEENNTNQSTPIGETCFEFDPELSFTRVLTRNQRADGRRDGDADNILDLNTSFQTPIGQSGLKLGLVLGLNSNLGNGNSFYTGLDADYRRENFEILLRFVPQNISEDFTPFRFSLDANGVVIPASLNLGGGFSVNDQSVYVESQDYTVSDDLVASLNFNAEIRLSPEDRVCSGLVFSVGLSQSTTFGFGIMVSNCSHLFDQHSTREVEALTEQVMHVEPVAEGSSEGSGQVDEQPATDSELPANEGSGGNPIACSPSILDMRAEGSGGSTPVPCSAAPEVVPVQPVAPATPQTIQFECNGNIITLICNSGCDHQILEPNCNQQ